MEGEGPWEGDEEMERTEDAMSELQRQLSALEDRRGRRTAPHVSFGELGGESVDDPNPMTLINLHEVVHLRHLSQPRAETSAATVATEASSVCSTSSFGALCLSYLVEPLQRHGADDSSVDGVDDDSSVAVIAPMRAAQATDDDANDGSADGDGVDVEVLRGGAAHEGEADGGAAASFLDRLLVGAADDVDDTASDRAMADGWSSVVGAASAAGSIDEERDARVGPSSARFSGFSALMIGDEARALREGEAESSDGRSGVSESSRAQYLDLLQNRIDEARIRRTAHAANSRDVCRAMDREGRLLEAKLVKSLSLIESDIMLAEQAKALLAERLAELYTALSRSTAIGRDVQTNVLFALQSIESMRRTLDRLVTGREAAAADIGDLRAVAGERVIASGSARSARKGRRR